MKSPLILICLALAVAPFADQGWAGEAVNNPPGRTEESIPVIALDNVPLTDAIRNLARHVEMNFILDPHILGPAGIFPAEPAVSYRWENLSAEEALRRILKDHKLKLVLNPATSVARITGTNKSVLPIPASYLGTNTQGPIPLIQMDGIPVSDAIRQICRQAGLNILFAPDAQAALDNSGGSRQWFAAPAPVTVSVRWKNITARQALAALLDNYDLILIEDSAKPAAQIGLKTSTGKSGARKMRQ